MKYVLILLLFITTAYAQENKSVVIDKDADGWISTLDTTSVIRRNEYGIFKLSLAKDKDNFYNVTGATRCTDHSYIFSLSEGKKDGKDYFGLGTEIYPTPEKGTRIEKVLNIVCKYDTKQLLKVPGLIALH